MPWICGICEKRNPWWTQVCPRCGEVQGNAPPRAPRQLADTPPSPMQRGSNTGTELAEKSSGSTGASGMKLAGGLLTAAAVVVLIYGLSMETSVPTLSGRVANLGLMHDQEVAVLIAVGLFIGGVILFAFGARANSSDRPEQRQATKKCPDCAELVQQDARICRFCQHCFSDDPQTAGPTAATS